jgi:putative DNA primase/helicase
LVDLAGSPVGEPRPLIDYQTLERLFAQYPGRTDRRDAPCPECGPRCRSPHNGTARKLGIWRGRHPNVLTFHCVRCHVKGVAIAKGRTTYYQPSRPPPEPPDNTPPALALYRRTHPAPGTLVETYLRERSLILPIPPRVRFHPNLRHPSGHYFPAMVALVTDVADRPAAVHRTWLTPDGTKAPVEPQRMSLGPIRGNALRLTPVAAELLVGEGLESCLSALQATSRPTWSALSTGGLRTLVLPREVRSIIILADGDDAGEAAAAYAAQRWVAEDRRVRIARPPTRGKDFNDILRGAA